MHHLARALLCVLFLVTCGFAAWRAHVDLGLDLVPTAVVFVVLTAMMPVVARRSP